MRIIAVCEGLELVVRRSQCLHFTQTIERAVCTNVVELAVLDVDTLQVRAAQQVQATAFAHGCAGSGASEVVVAMQFQGGEAGVVADHQCRQGSAYGLKRGEAIIAKIKPLERTGSLSCQLIVSAIEPTIVLRIQELNGRPRGHGNVVKGIVIELERLTTSTDNFILEDNL